MIDGLLPPIMWLAALGFITSACVHIGALLGIQVITQPMLLGPGIFIVWLPTVLISKRLVKDFKQKDFWKAALRGCPDWMRKGVGILFAYAIINFALFIINAPNGGHTQIHGPQTFAEIRGFTGHFMIFYAVAFASLYSAIQTAKSDPTLRCPSGHPVPPSAKFCEQCGAEIPSKSRLGK